MDTDTAAMQREAEERVKRMQARSRQLLKNGPTFGGACVTEPPTPVKRQTDDRWLLLLLILMLSQNGGSTPLLLLLAYLSI